MSKPIEEHLAEYLLNLQRGEWTKRYNQQCLSMWREIHGDRVADRVEAIVRKQWKK